MNTIKKIVIVGGGSSGWMTAAGLYKRFPDYDITLIESSEIPTIGVGESTLPSFTSFKNMLGLDDKDWMPQCNATYKLSIDFTNWDAKGTRVKNAFFDSDELTEDDRTKERAMTWFYKDKIKSSHKDLPFIDYTLSWGPMLTSNNKFMSEYAGFQLGAGMNAYHIDAGLFGAYLRKYTVDRVNNIIGTVSDVKVVEGNVDRLVLEDGTEIRADLFIDCSGFKRLLASKVDQHLTSFSDILKNDSAWAVRVPYIDIRREMEHSTNATTLSSGWVWNIPLFNRIGTGYVYSSQFQSKEQALEEYKDFLTMPRNGSGASLSKDIIEELDFFHVDVKPQVSKTPWTGNVVSIGLTSGFVEPLGSTGLHLTIEGVLNLISTLGSVSGGITNIFRQEFNELMYKEWKTFANYISLHFALSRRYDTPYWRYISDKVSYGDLSILTDLTDITTFKLMFKANFGWNRFSEQDLHGLEEEVKTLVGNIEKDVDARYDEVSNMGYHYDYLKDNIYA
jgi:tryptophan halogenase